VAVLRGDAFISKTLEATPHSAQRVLPLIADLLDQAQVQLGQIDAMAVMAGPGSFTGIRIGIGVAQGLSAAHNTPVLPLSCLAVKAFTALRLSGEACVLVSEMARDTEVYFAAYRQSAAAGVELLGAEQVVVPADIRLEPSHRALSSHWLIAGNGWQAADEIQRHLGINLQTPPLKPEFDSRDLCQLAALRFAQGQAVSAEQALPNYVKENMEYSR